MVDTQGSVFPKIAEMTHQTSENAYLYAVGRMRAKAGPNQGYS